MNRFANKSASTFNTDRRMLLKMGAAATMLGVQLPTLGADGKEANLPALQPPSKGGIPVAILISNGAVVIDFAGPWEVFQDVRDFSRGDAVDDVVAFKPFTVAATLNPITASGGMTLVPNYTFATAPQPRVIVIPAQSGAGETELAWLRKARAFADITMSVCTGALLLARTGLLDGKSATTHHSAFDLFTTLFPKTKLERNVRYVDHGNIATSAGLSAGIDLALHVVERYFGRSTALQTAKQMEYRSNGWMAADANTTSDHNHDTATNDNPDPIPIAGYVCPPCGCAADGRVFAKPGPCPACGMQMIKKG